MNEKQFYTSPEVDILVVRFEENVMSNGEQYSGSTDWDGKNGWS